MSAITEEDQNEDSSHPIETPLSSPGELLPSIPGRTLLPGTIASAVSFAARSTSFAIRVGTFIGSYGLGAAKFTTLSSLELSRGILEGILSRAGKDVMSRTRSELGRSDAESILEKSLESLHQAMSQIVFWTATSFHITDTTVSSASQISQLFLSVLDQFFGSTDSSRAIASIITLIRREFQNPATGVQGERVGVIDLLLGLCGLAYLQNWCRKMIQDESRRLCQEEIIWDVVLLDDDRRVDVDGEDLHISQGGRHRREGSGGNDSIIEAIERHGARLDSTDEDESPETRLKQHIIRSLPKDAQVSINTSTTTTKTITVDIKGAPLVPILSLPGVDLVKSEIRSNAPEDQEGSSYRVVYKISRNKVRNTAADSDGDGTKSRVEAIEDGESDSSTSFISRQSDQPPPVPPKPDRPTFASAAKRRESITYDCPARHNMRSPSGSVISSKGRISPPISSKQSPEHIANQKRARKPLDTQPAPRNHVSVSVLPTSSKPASKKLEPPPTVKANEKKGGIRGVLKKRSSLLNRDSSSENLQTATKSRPTIKPPWGSNKPSQGRVPSASRKEMIPNRSSSLLYRDTPRAAQRGSPNHFTSKDLGEAGGIPSLHGPQSRTTYVSLHDRRRESIVSLTDTFSVHSFESRPSSPAFHRNEPAIRISRPEPGSTTGAQNPPQGHIRTRSENHSLYSPSIYTLKTRDSQASLALSTFHQKSAYSDSEAVDTLRSSGVVEGMFPEFHILRNITRYSRYASAAYGSHFLKFMGITKELPVLKGLDETHRDVRSFAHHTQLPPDSILLSSFVDPQGGSDSTGSTDTGIPLVHTIAIDEESKAIVLSCRGTLGFEDVLADMMCEYDDLVWRGKPYKVHKGIHASARRLLYGGDGRVLATLKEALEEFSDYGLVLCGHSLGGAVTALLGVMLAEPSSTGAGFVTSSEPLRRLLADGQSKQDSSHICLPSGRPIHVYAYGPPSTVSPSLQKATRGLITSTVHGNDLVPYLSLGVLHDFQALALAFKTDNSDAKAEVRRRIWVGLQSGLADKWYNNGPTRSTEEEDKWAYAALKTLRASMMSSKLLPPGEVFAIETTPALRRDATLQAGTGQVGRLATRVVFKYVRDVEARFREVRFGSSMLLDHSPGRYEDALRRLTFGVVEV
ncbi:uncharacterized protein F4807DRAFT_386073 [Annulohypoxylon truncatum]|uniref:uncharacterized protein n=1 Tax=Annulohypoxylon truncatum TaxID=327061 RepID=UPI0020074030|nr:uncharacterized protein F4807DRAFT_386073 [Annulohypoxylon truncatum]KAI1212037.1 hypothetical protein F4807DRAFT_386073 [Annulohypoxylon truncatum]